MRQTMNKRTFLAMTMTTFLCASLASGCKNSREEARDVARTFVSAAQEGDQEHVAQVLTSQARENAGTSMRAVGQERHDSGGQSFTVGEGYVNADRARVPITLTDETGTHDADLHLRREDGQWRVYSIALKSGFGPTLNIDFEHPENTLGEAFHTAGQALGMMARGLEQGAKGFEAGFNQGYGKSRRDTPGSEMRSGTIIEEVPLQPAHP